MMSKVAMREQGLRKVETVYRLLCRLEEMCDEIDEGTWSTSDLAKLDNAEIVLRDLVKKMGAK